MTETTSKPRPLPITVASRPDTLWPRRAEAATLRRLHVAQSAVVAMGIGYLLWRVASTLSPASIALGVPLLILETLSLGAFALNAHALWDVDAVERPEPVTATTHRVAVLIPTRDEPHQVLMPTLAAATRMRLATQIIVLDDGHREWLAGMCDELGVEYRTRSTRAGGRPAQLNAAIGTLATDFVVVLDGDQVVDRDFIGHTLPHFDDPRVALVQTPRDSYNTDSFEHTGTAKRRVNSRDMLQRLLGAGRNRWNAAGWNNGGVILRAAALADVDGVAAGSFDAPAVTTIRLHRRGWRSVHHDEVLVRGRAANDAAEYFDATYTESAAAIRVLRRERILTGPGLRATQRIAHLAALSRAFDGWTTLGYLVLPAAALLFAATPAAGPVVLFVALITVVFLTRRLADHALRRGRAPRSPSAMFGVLRMTASLAATSTLLTGRIRERPRRRGGPPQRESITLWALLLLNGVALAWAFATVVGLTPLEYANPLIALGAAGWSARNVVVVALAISRIRSTEFGPDQRKAHRIEVEGHVFLDGLRVHILDLSLTGVRLLSYGPVPEVDAYCTMTFTDPNKRPAVVTGTVVGVDPRPHGQEVRVDLEPDQTYVLGAILAEALIRRA